jgi:ribosomal protein S18 acetylase RimI-like enzyme
LGSNKDAICLIAEEGSRKIGYIAAAKKNISACRSRYIEIENMGVIPDFRSKGIGALLIKECMKVAKSRGFQKAYVNAYIKNTEAVDFYKRNGFLEIDVSLERNI